MLLFLVDLAWSGTLLLDVLDVGQGDALLVQADGERVLIDAGDVDSTTERQLVALGVDHLDVVIATHPHADHIGRMAAVLRSIPVDRYLDNGMTHTTATYERLMDAIEEKHIPHGRATQGLVVELGDEARLTVLHPDPVPLSGTRSDLNANSVVLLLEHHDVSVLLMGDAEEPTEAELLRDGLPDVDVLKVAHHGSGHSTEPPFLAATKPELALISVGEGNRYRHPDPDAIARLVHAGAEVFRTDRSSHLRLISDGHGVEVLEGPLDEVAHLPVVVDTRVASAGPTMPASAPASPGTQTPKAGAPVPLTRKQLRQQRRLAKRDERRARRERAT